MRIAVAAIHMYTSWTPKGNPDDASMTLLLLLFLAGPMTVTGLSMILFWYEVAASPHRKTLERISCGRLTELTARCFLQSLASQVFALATYWLGLVPTLWRPHKPVKGPAIIFVHGLYHSAAAWILFRRWFIRAGRTNIHAWSYNSLTRDVPSLARHLTGLIRDVAAANPGHPLVLIGHSMGGLIIRLALADPATPPVAGVITMGTPHRGSKLAAFGLGRTARSLLCGSELIRELNRTAVTRGIPFLSLASPTDNMVMPPMCLCAPRGAAWQEEVTAPVTHVAMLYDRRLARRCLRFITKVCAD